MSQPLTPGDPRRLGDFELLGRLGEGGMGTVYLGRAPQGRLVAIKVVRREFAADEEFLRRFRSEVNRAGEVPPFCTAEVIGADPDHDPPYLVVEFVDGPSLAGVVRDQGPLRGAALHGVAIGIATALTAIHGARVIHRDLKPQNVLMARGGVKVIDFGIARPLEVTSVHTRPDQMVGTVAYMAPERFEAEQAATVSFPADIFAWGAVVAYAATGRTPFAAESAPGTAMRILTQPPRLDGLHRPLRDIVERSLAKDPADRPTARELLDLLLAARDLPATVEPSPARAVESPPVRVVESPPAFVVESSPAFIVEPPPAEPSSEAGTPSAYRSGAVSRPPRPARQRRVLTAVACVLLPVGGLGAAYAFSSGTPGSPEPSRSPAARPAASTPSPAATGLPGILAGRRRTLVHLATVDRDLALPQNALVKTGGGTTPESVFVLVPKGVRYEIRSAVDDLSGTPRCLAVKVRPGGSARLAPAGCAASDTTLFRLAPTGRSDEKNRPTYTLSSEKYGLVQWSEDKHVLYVEEAGDFPATVEFSFVDRGSA